MANEFGIIMKDMRCKVTMDPKEFNWGTILPCSIGFKDKKSGKWANLFIDIMVTDKTSVSIPLVKGDAFKCWGNMNLREWEKQDGTKVPQWSCWADRIEPVDQQGGQSSNGMDPIPF